LAQHEAWIATDCNDDDGVRAGACRGALVSRDEPVPPAPARSSAEPCLSSFVEISQIICRPAAVSNAAVMPEPATATPQAPNKGGYNVAYPDRGTVISRYKEKRKNRRLVIIFRDSVTWRRVTHAP
jgi:hypothetical protein